METVGDKYMAVSGLPEYEVAHARHISLLALEMMDLSQTVTVDGEPVVSRFLLSDTKISAVIQISIQSLLIVVTSRESTL